MTYQIDKSKITGKDYSEFENALEILCEAIWETRKFFDINPALELLDEATAKIDEEFYYHYADRCRYYAVKEAELILEEMTK